MSIIKCKVSNPDAGFQIQVNINAETNADLFKDENELIYSGKQISLLPNIEKDVQKEEDLFLPFQALSSFLGKSPEELLHLFLIMLARENKQAYRILCTSRKPIFIKKKNFIQTFRAFLKNYCIPNSKNSVAPDFLMELACHCYYQKTNGKADFEIPNDLVLFVLNITGIIPEEKRFENYQPVDSTQADFKGPDLSVEPETTNKQFFKDKEGFLKKLFQNLK